MKLKSFKDYNVPRKMPEYPILQAIRKHIDPCAVVAGGRALQLAYGIPSNDVDIYFTSLYTFKSVLMQKVRKAIELELPGINADWTGNPKYGNGIELMGTLKLDSGLQVQLIWAELPAIPTDYKSRVRAILNTFDISICKVAIDYSSTNFGFNGKQRHIGFGFYTITTNDFDNTLSTKNVLVNPQMTEYQKGKTLETRIPKYKKRFKSYKFFLEGKKI